MLFAWLLKAAFSERVGECAEEVVMLGALSHGRDAHRSALDELCRMADEVGC
jgi:hypothetical protein